MRYFTILGSRGKSTGPYETKRGIRACRTNNREHVC